MHLIIKKRRKTKSASTRPRRYRLSQKAEKSESAVTNYFRKNILLNAAIGSGPDGYYTWLFKLTGEGPLFVAAQTRSEQELGTLHVNMDHLTTPGEVLLAGEFMKVGERILFNLQSGTYMQRRMKGISAAKRSKMIDDSITEFAKIGLIATFNEATPTAPKEEQVAGNAIIENAEIVTRLSTLEEYNRLLSWSSSSEK